MWCFGRVVLALSSPTRPGLLEMLRQCGVLDMYSISSVQPNKTWSAGNAQAMWCVGHAELALSSPTSPGLLEMLRQCGVLGMQYWLGPVQQDLVCWKSSGSVVFWVRSICSV